MVQVSAFAPKFPLELSSSCMLGMMNLSLPSGLSFEGAQQLHHQAQLKHKSLIFLEEKEPAEVSAVRMGGVSLKKCPVS